MAVAKAASEALGIQMLAADLGLADLGLKMRVVVHTDFSEDKAIANRSEFGKVRHLETNLLWIQEAVRTKRIEVHKVRGDANPADILMKPMDVCGGDVRKACDDRSRDR